ncbi:MAG: hypothetical protein JXX29_05555 [Deltaproteobacteria bacterium]|nr:hypothetical protein [Deltaproteobacteria bacterium]MBN2671115.1 hypothetical protein [Deltaproteobacteria bacterium]
MITEREAAAEKEIGHTDISRRSAIFLTAAFLILIVTGAVLDLVFRVFSTPDPLVPAVSAQPVQPGPFQAARQINADKLSQITAYENQLNQQSPITRWFVPPVQKLFFKALRFGNEKVYVGKGKWLFYRPGMDYLTGANFMNPRTLESRARSGAEWQDMTEPDPIPALIEFKNELEAQGITLLVVPTPTKAMIYGDQFAIAKSLASPPLNNPGYKAFTTALNKAGVHIVHLHELFSTHREIPLYLQTDSHWTPAGMSLAADAISERVRELIPDTAKTNPPYRISSTAIETRGDLAAMLRMSDSTLPINLEKARIEQVLQQNNSPWQPETSAPVLLLGDSFSNIYSLEGMNWGTSAGLAEHISYRLQQPIDAIRINDNGSFATRAYLSRLQQQGKNRLSGKKVVIYQFAIRELAKGNWKTQLPMTPKQAPRADALLRGSVSGTVSALKPISRNDDSTYRDCLIPIVLKNPTPKNGTAFQQDIIVYVWGMRNGKRTEWNQKRIGESISLRITPFEEQESRMGSFRRLDFTDEAHLLLPTYLADEGAPGNTPAPTDVAAAEPKQQNTTHEHATQRMPASEPPQTKQFLDAIASMLEASDAPVVDAADSGWLLLRQELVHLTKGVFWGPAAAVVSESENEDAADPLPAILDFHHQLQQRGISLVLVPVPPKAVIYPDTIDADLTVPATRADMYHQQFYELLRKEGVTVLDLTDKMIEAKTTDTFPLYCKQDSHWSPSACQLAAREIHAQIASLLKGVAVPHKKYARHESNLTIEGDLRQKLNDTTVKPETIHIVSIFEQQPSPPEGTTWKESPVLLIGDSHTLVYHVGGDLHAEHAGLADHLAAELGFPIDVMGIRGSGTTMARVSLLRRKDSLTNKKVVLWCFTARDFTESTSGWAIVPVAR